MENILSLDISTNPIQSVVVAYDEKETKVVDSLSIFLLDDEYKAFLSNLYTNYHYQNQSTEITSNKFLLDQNLIDRFANFQDFYKKYEANIINSVLVFEPESYFSLNVDMPFGQEKVLDQVLDIELQEYLPFELEGFIVSRKIIEKINETDFDINLALTKKHIIENSLEFCKQINFDPKFITTVSGALGGFRYLRKNIEDQIFIAIRNNRLYLNSFMNDKFRDDQIFDLGEDLDLDKLVSKIKMFLLSCESRYNDPVNKVNYVGNIDSVKEIENKLGLQVIQEDIKFVKSDEQAVAALAAFSIINPDENLLVNFRVRNFSYNPYFKVIKEVAFKLWPYSLVLLLFGLFSFLGFYYFKERQIDTIRQYFKTEIASKISDLTFSPGSELTELFSYSSQIEQQLDNLVSASRYNPTDVFVVLTEELKDAVKSEKMDLIEVDIQGNEVRLQGTVINYRSVNKIEKILKKRKDVFCEVKADTSSGRTVNKNFTFKLKLC